MPEQQPAPPPPGFLVDAIKGFGQADYIVNAVWQALLREGVVTRFGEYPDRFRYTLIVRDAPRA